MVVFPQFIETFQAHEIVSGPRKEDGLWLYLSLSLGEGDELAVNVPLPWKL